MPRVSMAAWLCAAAFLCLQVLSSHAAPCRPGGDASVGFIQMQSISKACPPGDRNGIFTACGVAFKVDVSSLGVVKMTPIAQGSVSWQGPGVSDDGLTGGVFNCKNINGTGVLNGKPGASIKLYDELSGPFSQLVAAGGKLTFTKAKVYDDGEKDTTSCVYTYTVVSGCVLGIAAPSKPYDCPSGTTLASGALGQPYCAPCPVGKTSQGPNAAKCTACPAGTYNPDFAGTCKGCDAKAGYYSARTGASVCSQCVAANYYTDGKSCKACPAGSYVNGDDARQCHKCNGASRCCTVGASGSCPKCSAGFKAGQTLTSTFTIDSVSSPRCGNLEAIRCNADVKVTISPDCRVTALGTSPVRQIQVCDHQSESRNFKGAKLDPFKDLPPLLISTQFRYAKLTAVKAPYINFTFPAPINCAFSYRALDGGAAPLLGSPAKPCPLGTPGCATKPTPAKPSSCPPGKYVRNSAGKPGYCAPCPPGSSKSNWGPETKCTQCEEGTIAASYGSTRCTRCKPGTKVPLGQSFCHLCEGGRYTDTYAATKCSRCPKGSGSQQGWSHCLSTNAGKPCCAAGLCDGLKGVAKCPETRPFQSTQQYQNLGAVVKVLEGLSATCKKQAPASGLTCLRAGDLVSVRPDGDTGHVLLMTAINSARCSVDGTAVAIANAHYLDGYHAYGVDLGSDTANSRTPYPAIHLSALGKSTLHASLIPFSHYDKPSSPPSPCTVKFTLTAGHIFNLSPPSSAKCPAGGITVTTPSPLKRSFCSFCQPGYYPKGASCQFCPDGTYAPYYGAPSCRKCPAGSVGYGTFFCQQCEAGKFSPEGSTTCGTCPKNTYSAAGADKCLPCGPNTYSPPGSAGCSPPFGAF